MAISCLSCQPRALSPPAILLIHQRRAALSQLPRLLTWHNLHSSCRKPFSLFCMNSSSWQEDTPAYAPTDEKEENERETNIFESIIRHVPHETLVSGRAEDVEDSQQQPSVQPESPRWPMWLLGPSVLLATGVVPTLWLPLSAVFVGPNIAGVLSLVGLDCIFNMGATLFLLMADSCAHPKNPIQASISNVPQSYKFWNLSASIVGVLIPMAMLLFSSKSFTQGQLPFISFAVLLGPYLLLLAVQMITEMLTWRWKSPVWLVTPIVYEAYRVLQLMRGLRLGIEIGAPLWVVHSIRGLVSWWILILGMQLMRVAWFAGFAAQMQHQEAWLMNLGDSVSFYDKMNVWGNAANLTHGAIKSLYAHMSTEQWLHNSAASPNCWMQILSQWAERWRHNEAILQVNRTLLFYKYEPGALETHTSSIWLFQH